MVTRWIALAAALAALALTAPTAAAPAATAPGPTSPPSAGDGAAATADFTAAVSPATPPAAPTTAPDLDATAVATPPAAVATPPAAVATPPAAVATSPAEDGRGEATLHHAPLATARAHRPLALGATVEFPEQIRRIVVVYTVGADTTLRTTTMRRAARGYVAEIPAEQVVPPGLAYALEIEGLDGARVAAFAGRDSLHRVAVREDHAVVRERALLERVHGARSVFSGGGEYVDFGRSTADVYRTDTGQMEEWQVSDFYYRVEGSYTYRPLRTVNQFSLRFGVVRGSSPVANQSVLGAGVRPTFDVGLNYGAPTLELSLGDRVRLELEALASVTEVGFSTGAGAALSVGHAYATRGTLGCESIEVFGTRCYSRFDAVASPTLTLSPIIEVTNMPHADRFGVRLLTEATLGVGAGFGVALRGGYQARDFESGGLSAGGAVTYSF